MLVDLQWSCIRSVSYTVNSTISNQWKHYTKCIKADTRVLHYLIVSRSSTIFFCLRMESVTISPGASAAYAKLAKSIFTP